MLSIYLECMGVVALACGIPTLIVLLCLAIKPKSHSDYDEIRELAKYCIFVTIVGTLLGPITLAAIALLAIGVILFGIYRAFRG